MNQTASPARRRDSGQARARRVGWPVFAALLGGGGQALAEPAQRTPEPPEPVIQLLAVTTAAAVTSATAHDLALAMDIPAGDIVSATSVTSTAGLSGTTDPVALGVGTSPLGTFFPVLGESFSILATGRADTAANANTSGSTSSSLTGLNNQRGWDTAQITLELMPPPGANCLSFDFAFYSEEFPEWVNTAYNDAFTAELGGSNFTIQGSGADITVAAPNDFAFDTSGRPISVNSTVGVEFVTDSTYDGRTPLLRARTPFSGSGPVKLTFTIQDMGDSSYDSAVLLDNFRWGTDSP